MGQQNIAGLAVLVALLFSIMALTACANSEQDAGPLVIAGPSAAQATPEFHGARIGGDALRSRLSSDN